MSKIRLVSDTHIGLSRQSHTTPASSARLRDALWGAAVGAIQDWDEVIHLGDLFDKYSNPESVMVDGANVMKACSAVLAGNHDMANRDGCLSSLQLLDRLTDSMILLEPCTFLSEDRKVVFHAVPHCMTQTAFEEALETATQWHNKDLPWVLLLHCNYDNPMAAGSEASLNLTRERAGTLLETFDLVLLGHEHAARSDFGGRLQVLGSLHPTSFSDISDKYAWTLDTGTLELGRECVWKWDRHMKIDWRDLGTACSSAPLEFLDITGTASPSGMRTVADAVQKAWKNNPSLYMVRNSVVVEGAGAVAVTEAHKALNVADRVRAELAGTPMGELFEGYVRRVV
jgi:DNA repair exonuclease SbcCD nuclease subunit